jgi:hypothetical protein
MKKIPVPGNLLPGLRMETLLDLADLVIFAPSPLDILH